MPSSLRSLSTVRSTVPSNVWLVGGWNNCACATCSPPSHAMAVARTTTVDDETRFITLLLMWCRSAATLPHRAAQNYVLLRFGIDGYRRHNGWRCDNRDGFMSSLPVGSHAPAPVRPSSSSGSTFPFRDRSAP